MKSEAVVLRSLGGAGPQYNLKMFFVYILRSQKDSSMYVGVTENVKKRLAEHNCGTSRYSKTKQPYIMIWYCAFIDKAKALDFEKYIKI